MGDGWSGMAEPPKTTLFFNSLDRIDDSWLPKSVAIWMNDGIMLGLKVSYTNGSDLQHGECSGDASEIIDIKDSEADFAIQLVLEAAEVQNAGARVRALQLTMNTCKSKSTPNLGASLAGHKDASTISLSQPTNGFWSFRGFWGSVAPQKGGFVALGAVWGLDDPKLHEKTTSQAPSGPLGPDYQMFVGRPLPEDALRSANEFRSKAGTYCMSNLIGESPIDKDKLTYFNDLGRIQDGALVDSVTFYSEVDDYLTGYIIRYIGNKPAPTRRFCPSNELGQDGTGKALHFMGTTIGLMDADEDNPEALNFIVLNELHGSDYKKRGGKTEDVSAMALSPPSSSWSLVGFWGYRHNTLKMITHLGIIWARQSELEG